MRFSDFDSAKVLLQHGADINLYNSIGQTPLHETVVNRNHDAIRFLLAHGADLNKMTVEAHVRTKYLSMDIHQRGGDVSLQMALSISDTTSLRLLVEAGAKLCADDQGPWTILDLALLAGDLRAIKALLHRGFKLPVESSAPGNCRPGTDYSGSSRDLLALARGDKLLPPNELYGTYCHAIWKAVEEGKLSRDTADIDVSSLVRSLFEVLQDAADPKRQTRKKKMCASCQKFQSEASCIFEARKPLKFLLHHGRQHLNDSAGKGCPLCGITTDALDQDERNLERRGAYGQRVYSTSSVFIKIELSPNDTDSLCLSSLSASCGDLSIPMDMTYLDDNFIPTHEDQDKPDISTSSAGAIQVARKWLQACRDGNTQLHSACRKAYSDEKQRASWPRRLLYIGEIGRQPNLVLSQGIRAPYCALSYCWGTKNFFTTTRDNLQQSMKSIQLNSLPEMMVDAVFVTRALGYSYLWIDALCIIQDDVDDWDHEAASMHAIYSNANLTISTIVASDCHTSLFTPRIHRVTHPVPLDIWEPKKTRRSSESLAVLPTCIRENQSVRGPVHSRGWTLQEQLLSTRILWFGDGMLHLECLGGYTFEPNPVSMGFLNYSVRLMINGRIAAKRAIKATLSEEQGSAEELSQRLKSFQVWKQQIEEFTRRCLTKSSDRLPAIISISNSLASIAGNQFLHGIWNGDRLLESLCWRVVKPLPQTKITNLPSWTWATIDGEILFDMVNGKQDPEIRSASSVSFLGIQVNESLSLPDSITLRATLRQKKPFDMVYAVDPFMMRFGHTSEIGGHIYLDHEFESLENCYAIDVLSFPRGAPFRESVSPGVESLLWPEGHLPKAIKLLLQPINEDLNVFRRVGVGVVTGVPADRDYKLGPEGKLRPLTWLVVDEEILEDREIVII